MKFHTQLLAASILTAAVGSAYAATSAELTVTGTIVAPACNILLSSDGKADFGDIARGTLSATATTGIGSRAITAEVTCDALTAIAIKTVDNRPTLKPTGNMNVKFEHIGANFASVATANIFGLGQSSNMKPIGGYAIRVGKITVDSLVLPNIGLSSTGLASSWRDQGELALMSQTNPFLMASASSSMVYANGETFSFPMDVAASIDLTGNIPGTEDVSLDGNATLEVIYL